ncbi:MAG: SIR2 family protein [archaeon]
MSDYDAAIESIAFSASKRRLALFLGTGFSKSLVTFIPTWTELMEEICKKLGIKHEDICKDKKNKDRSPQNIASIMPFLKKFDECLDEKEYCECARLQLKKHVAEHIKKVTPERNVILFLPSYEESLRIINPQTVFTTNFDDVTNFPFRNPKIIDPGCKYDNSVDGTRIMYIHGHVNKPQEMVLTEEDFLKFNSENKYFKSLLYASFVENTTLFLGYSLNDQNIKQILYDIALRENKNDCGRRFLFVPTSIPPPELKHDIDYFESTYNVVVIQAETINKFLKDIAHAIQRIQNEKKDNDAVERVFVLLRDSNQINSLIENEDLFNHILSFLGGQRNLLDKPSLDFITRVLDKIKDASGESLAFAEYAHLAKYLVSIGKHLEIAQTGTDFSSRFLKLFKHVLCFSGDSNGKSWASARFLREHFNSQKEENKEFLKKDEVIAGQLQRLCIK